LSRPLLRAKVIENDRGRVTVLGRIRPVLWQIWPVALGPGFLVMVVVSKAQLAALLGGLVLSVVSLGLLAIERADYEADARRIEDLLRVAIGGAPKR